MRMRLDKWGGYDGRRDGMRGKGEMHKGIRLN
jgi:hypothetical protein